MTILLPALAVAFAAFCVWLGVRIVNRRERWAKWTLVAVVGPPMVYIATFGPVWWLSKQHAISPGGAQTTYWPIIRAAHKNDACRFVLDKMASLFGCHREFFDVLYTDYEHEVSGSVIGPG